MAMRVLRGGGGEDQSGGRFDPTKTKHRVIPDWLLRLTEVSIGAKLIYAALLGYRDERTGLATASAAELAADTGISTKHAEKLLAELVTYRMLWSPRCGEPIPRWAFTHHSWMTDEIPFITEEGSVVEFDPPELA